MDIKDWLKDIFIEQVAESLGLIEKFGLKRHGNSLQGECPSGHGSKEGRCFSMNHRRIFTMRNALRSISIAIVLVLVLSGGLPAKEIVLTNGAIQVCFSPGGGCTDSIVKELNKAKKEILVQAYSFTSLPIAKALVDAHKRGVCTEIVLDKSQRGKKYGAADFTAHMGVPTYIDFVHAIAHNKIMVIDQETVITGKLH